LATPHHLPHGALAFRSCRPETPGRSCVAGARPGPQHVRRTAVASDTSRNWERLTSGVAVATWRKRVSLYDGSFLQQVACLSTDKAPRLGRRRDGHCPLGLDRASQAPMLGSPQRARDKRPTRRVLQPAGRRLGRLPIAEQAEDGRAAPRHRSIRRA